MWSPRIQLARRASVPSQRFFYQNRGRGYDLFTGREWRARIQCECVRCLVRVADRARGFWKVRVHQQGDDSSIGNELMQQPQPLAAEQGAEKAHSRNQHGLRHLAATARRCAIAGRLGQQSDEGRVGMRGFVLGSMLMLAMVSGAMPYPVALTILTLRWSSASVQSPSPGLLKPRNLIGQRTR
jgi:hypothetical protein